MFGHTEFVPIRPSMEKARKADRVCAAPMRPAAAAGE
jgi:hypothetical protein